MLEKVWPKRISDLTKMSNSRPTTGKRGKKKKEKARPLTSATSQQFPFVLVAVRKHSDHSK